MHDDGAGILRAILEDPQDDLPRLAYADWCEEHGDAERAEFIRVQLELAKLELQPGRPEEPMRRLGWLTAMCRERRVLEAIVGSQTHRCERCLRERERELLPLATGRHGCRLLPEAAGDWRFGRGFVCEITLPLAAFEQHAGAIFATHPVTRVMLSDRVPYRWTNGGCSWGSEREYDVPDRLPDRLFSLLPDHGLSTSPLSMRGFADYRAAFDALSDAGVAYGRELAGLPPLEATR